MEAGAHTVIHEHRSDLTVLIFQVRRDIFVPYSLGDVRYFPKCPNGEECLISHIGTECDKRMATEFGCSSPCSRTWRCCSPSRRGLLARAPPDSGPPFSGSRTANWPP